MPQKATDEELISHLQMLAETVDRTPTLEDMDERGDYSGGTYEYRFGTWTKALEAADIEFSWRPPGNAGAHYTEAELLNHLADLSEKLGRRPSAQNMADYGNHSPTTYTRYFGSWTKTLKRLDERS